jgi:hypothetical protein
MNLDNESCQNKKQVLIDYFSKCLEMANNGKDIFALSIFSADENANGCLIMIDVPTHELIFYHAHLREMLVILEEVISRSFNSESNIPTKELH